MKLLPTKMPVCFFPDSNSCPDDSVVTLQCTGTFKHVTFVTTQTENAQSLF